MACVSEGSLLMQMQLESHDQPEQAQEDSSMPKEHDKATHGRGDAHESLVGSALDLGPLGNFLLARCEMPATIRQPQENEWRRPILEHM